MLLNWWSRIAGTPVPERSVELRKDSIYIIMMPEEDRKEFIKSLDNLDLSEGPEILVIDEMHMTVVEFSKMDKQAKVIQVGKS